MTILITTKKQWEIYDHSEEKVQSLANELNISTTEISKREQPETFDENVKIAKRGGTVAGNARKEIEQETGKPVITSKNAAELNKVVTDLIEGIAEDKEK